MNNENNEKAEKKTTEKKATRGSIVILDDAIPILTIFRFLMEKNDYVPLCYANGKLAIEQLKIRNPGDVKMIFCDIMMPDVGGFEFIKLLKSNNMFNNVPLVVMSALSDRDTIQEVKKLGSTAFLAKPISGKKIIEVMKKIFPDQTFKEII